MKGKNKMKINCYYGIKVLLKQEVDISHIQQICERFCGSNRQHIFLEN